MRDAGPEELGDGTGRGVREVEGSGVSPSSGVFFLLVVERLAGVLALELLTALDLGCGLALVDLAPPRRGRLCPLTDGSGIDSSDVSG